MTSKSILYDYPDQSYCILKIKKLKVILVLLMLDCNNADFDF